MWDFCTHSTPVARKPHVCGDCRKPIAVGEKYHRVSGVWEGAMTSYKSHLDCAFCCEEIRKVNHLDDRIWKL